jgi:hypothetical protein
MPRIRCNYEGCIHLEGNFCTASEIELDQELGCLTFSQVEEEDEAVGVQEEMDEIEEEEEWEANVEEDDDEEDLDEWEEEEDEEDWEDDDEDDEEDDGWSPSKSRRR